MRLPSLRPSIAIALIASLASVGHTRPEPTVDQVLAGRTPGKSVTCISQPQIDQTQTFSSGDILYRMKGGPDYLNAAHCTGLSPRYGLVTRTPSTQLCRGDIAQIVNFGIGGDFKGSCALSDFTPYPKRKR